MSARQLFPVLLTATAGAMDATAFLALGGVFASVMTGNMVMLGLSAGTADGDLAVAAGVAMAGYVTGAGAGSALARRSPLWALLAEVALLAGFTVVWETAGPDGPARWPLLVLPAVPMVALLVAFAAAWRGYRSPRDAGPGPAGT